ncbi:hypothetical protein [Haladaptatus caseinilyticus]|uniref:hypothetical protein n=1 Tax=Haladaptatus caseinilyticus TaxID=2993314 RepID=UPI00224A9962|nr:hypothetical protein [Haladaptatus caseinilyticus]
MDRPSPDPLSVVVWKAVAASFGQCDPVPPRKHVGTDDAIDVPLLDTVENILYVVDSMDR